MNSTPRAILTLLAIFSGIGSASAQRESEPLKLQSLNFDMWCQETQKLPPARCDRRSPADDAAFQTFSNKLETYEIENMRVQTRNDEINREIVHYDPVGRPTEFSVPQTDRPDRGN